MTSLNAIVRRIVLQEAVSAASRSIMRQAFAKYMLDLLRDVYATIPGQLDQVKAIALSPEERVFSPNSSVVARQTAERDREIARLMAKFKLGKPESDLGSRDHRESVQKIAHQFSTMQTRGKFSPPFDMMFLLHPQFNEVIFPKKVMDYLLSRSVVSPGKASRGAGLKTGTPDNIRRSVEKLRSLSSKLHELSRVPGVSEYERSDLLVFKDGLESLLAEFVESLQAFMARIETVVSSDITDRDGDPEDERFSSVSLEGEHTAGVPVRMSGRRTLPKGDDYVDVFRDLKEARIPRDALRRESQSGAVLMPTPVDLTDKIPLTDVPPPEPQEVASNLSEERGGILMRMESAAEDLSAAVESFVKPSFRDTEEAESVFSATDRIVKLIASEAYDI
jgi:hypothetical protein